MKKKVRTDKVNIERIQQRLNMVHRALVAIASEINLVLVERDIERVIDEGELKDLHVDAVILGRRIDRFQHDFTETVLPKEPKSIGPEAGLGSAEPLI